MYISSLFWFFLVLFLGYFLYSASDNAIVASNKNKEVVYQEIKKLVGNERCSNSKDLLDEYSSDYSQEDPGHPDIIVFPKTTLEVQEILKICYQYNMVVVAMGKKTSVEGQTITLLGGVIINMMKMNNILNLYSEDLQVEVEPGVLITELNEFLKNSGFFFPVKPGSNPSIGGVVSTRGSGMLNPKYSSIKENTVSLEIVLPNGELFESRKKSIKSSAGYDLTSLFIGSEGTLGIITKIRLKITKLPNIISSAVVLFDTFKETAETVMEFRQNNIGEIAKLEIVNSEGIAYVNEYGNLDLVEKPTLFIEFHSDSVEEFERSFSKCKKIVRKHNGSDFKFAVDEEERKKIWLGRYNYFLSFSAIAKRDFCNSGGLCRVTSEDIAVPLSKFAQIMEETEKDFHEHGIPCPIVGHSGDANFHIAGMINETNSAVQNELRKRLWKRSSDMGGTISGEHGIGLSKKEAMRFEYNEVGLEVMRKIKKALDPKNMMNPQKLIPEKQ